MKIYYTLICFTVILLSCKTIEKNNFNKIELINEKECVLEYKDICSPYMHFLKYKGDKPHLMVYSYYDKLILTFDLEGLKVVDSISLMDITDKRLISFYYHTDDSIFLAYTSTTHPKYWHDSTLFLINNKAEIKHVYNLEKLPVRTENKNMSMDSACFMSFYEGNLHFNNNNIHVLYSSLKWYPGDSEYENQKLNLGAKINLLNNNIFFYPVNFLTPKQIIGKGYMPRNFTFTRWAFNNANNPVFGFGHSAKMLYYDNTTNEIQLVKVPSVLYDSLTLNLHPERYSAPQIDYSIPEYLKINYNPWGNYYCRVLRIPDTSLTSNIFDPKFDQQDEPPGTLIFFDDKFNYKGETLIPFGYSLNVVFFDKEGLYLYNKQKSLKEKKIIIQKFKIRYRLSSKIKLKKELQNELKRRKIKKNYE